MMDIDFRVRVEESKRPTIDILLGGHKSHYQYCLDLRGKVQSVIVRNLALRPLYFVMNRPTMLSFSYNGNIMLEYQGDICYGVCPNSVVGTTPWIHYVASAKVEVFMLRYAPEAFLYQEGITECNTTDKELTLLLYGLAGLRKTYTHSDYYMYKLNSHLKEKMDKHAKNVRSELAAYFAHNITMKDSCVRAIDELKSFANKLDEFKHKEE